MKTLCVMRHAKSSWNEPGLSDRERGLNRRGERAAPRMGRALAERLEPMTLVVSPARRAQLTLEGLCAGWPALARLSHSTDDALYTFSGDEVMAWLQSQADREQTLFIIGHNPALTDLVNTLVGEDWLANLPTAGYVELSLQIDRWRDIRQGCAVVDFSLFPREL